MSDRSSSTSHPDARQPILARVPLAAAGAALVLGAVLADVQTVWLRGHEIGDPEPPQWVGLSTLMQYYLLIPLGLLTYRAHRRATLGRTGAVAAGMLTITALTQVAFWIGSLADVALTGADELPSSLMVVQSLLYLIYPGLLLLGVAFLRDHGVPRSVGVLLVLTFAASLAAVPGVLTLACTVLAVVAARTGLRRAVTAPFPQRLGAAG